MQSMLFPEPIGQSWLQFAELGLALVLSSLIGLEREIRQKSAGRGLTPLRRPRICADHPDLEIWLHQRACGWRVVLDPSRIAAQIVSGIGFIGGGVIFVRKDLVRGLTTATTIWVTSAVGMACGAGLPLLAIAVTAAHFIVIFGFMSLERHLPKSRWSSTSLRSWGWTGHLALHVLTACTSRICRTGVQVERDGEAGRDRRGKQSGRSRAREAAYATRNRH